MTSSFHHLLIYLFLLAHVSFGKQRLLRQHLSHHSPQHKTIPKNNNNNNNNDIHKSFTIKTNTREKTADIPSLEYTIEFAQLSNLVYQYHTLDYTSCTSSSSSREVDKDAKSHGNSTYNKNDGDEDDDGGKDEIELPKNVTCEMYEHDKEEGTQVLIVTSTTKKYIAVIYAGTDDVQSTILDGAFLQKQFDPNIPNNDDGNILVHSGFHNAVFKDGIYLRVLNKVQELKTMHNGGKEEYDIVTSGHSLGAASSILTAVAFAHHFNNHDDDDDDDDDDDNAVLVQHNKTITTTTTNKKEEQNEPKKILVLNFGCPRIGNKAWRTYVHSLPNISIYRFVLGRDIVPRVPPPLLFYYHVGHLAQMNDDEMLLYYSQMGEKEDGYAGAPLSWDIWPVVWLPDALVKHYASKYLDYLVEKSLGDLEKFYVSDFERLKENTTLITTKKTKTMSTVDFGGGDDPNGWDGDEDDQWDGTAVSFYEQFKSSQ